MGGWRAVADLRRGREAYRSDERVLGSSAFVETLLEEVDARSKERYRQVELSKLKKRIARDMGVSSHALAGVGRSDYLFATAVYPFACVPGPVPVLYLL